MTATYRHPALKYMIIGERSAPVQEDSLFGASYLLLKRYERENCKELGLQRLFVLWDLESCTPYHHASG